MNITTQESAFRNSIWAALVCVVFCVGCTESGLSGYKIPGLSKQGSPESEPTDRDELPPKENAKACMIAAEKLQNSGHGDQAILLYEKARRNDPDLKTVAHPLAVLYDELGDSTKSLVEFRLAIEAEPKSADVYSDLGYYYMKRSNLHDAETQLRKAIEINPKHQKAWNNLGMVLAGQNRYGESFEAFSQAVGPAAAHSNLGVLMAKQGRVEDARKEFHAALALDASLKQPQAFLAYLDR